MTRTSLSKARVAAFVIAATSFASPHAESLATPTHARASSAARSDADKLAAALQRKDGQPTHDLVARLAREHNLEALDALIAAKNAPLVGWYANVYHESLHGAVSLEIEQRLVQHYQDPAIAAALLRSMDHYASPSLADLLVSDVERFAKDWNAQTRQCRIVLWRPGQEFRRAGTTSLDGRERSKYAPPLMPVADGKAYSHLDCTGFQPSADAQQLQRWWSALILVGNTELPGMAPRIAPYIPQISASPAVESEAREAINASPALARISNLRSIVGAVGRERYVPAAHDLIVAIHSLDGRSGEEYTAAWPILQALAKLQSDEALPEIERWIELRAVNSSRLGGEPTLAAMVQLLALGPQDSGRLIALRDRVLEKVPYSELPAVSKAFRALPAVGSSNRGVPY